MVDALRCVSTFAWAGSCLCFFLLVSLYFFFALWQPDLGQRCLGQRCLLIGVFSTNFSLFGDEPHITGAGVFFGIFVIFVPHSSLSLTRSNKKERNGDQSLSRSGWPWENSSKITLEAVWFIGAVHGNTLACVHLPLLSSRWIYFKCATYTSRLGPEIW